MCALTGCIRNGPHSIITASLNTLYPPILSQYHFHFGYLPLTRGLTQFPALRAHAHRLTSCGHVDGGRVIDGAPQHAVIHHGSSGNGSCASLLFPWEPWKTLLLIPLNRAAFLTFFPPYQLCWSTQYDVWLLTPTVIVYFFRLIGTFQRFTVLLEIMKTFP